MGHNASAPCALCSFTKPLGEGARYAFLGSSTCASLVWTTARIMSVVRAVKYLLAREEDNRAASRAAVARGNDTDGAEDDRSTSVSPPFVSE